MSRQHEIELAFNDPESYPSGAGKEITRLMREQNIALIGSSSTNSTIYVVPGFGLKGESAVWCVFDNTLELHCRKVNTEISFDVNLADLRGLPTNDFALVVVVRMIAGFRGEEIDWRWRPPSGSIPTNEGASHAG